jgi:isoleucyl-tRNA synthetase
MVYPELGTEKELGITKEDIGQRFLSKNITKRENRDVIRTVWNDLTEKWDIG